MTPPSFDGGLIRQLGWPRAVAALLALATLPALWLQDLQTMPWSVLAGAVAPGVALFLLWAIPFDALMARVFMSDAEPDVRRRYQTVILTDLLLWAVLLLCWGGFFWRHLAQR